MHLDVRSCPPVKTQVIWPGSMPLNRPLASSLRFLRTSCFPGAFFVAAILVFALPSSAQDVAAAARKNQARKAKERRAPHHIYTNEDLKRPHILTPKDQARVEARKKYLQPPVAAQPSQSLDAGSPVESLGEIARRYRREKAAREAEQALKNHPPQFHLKLPATSLASPKPGIVPRNATSLPPARGERTTLLPVPSRVVPRMPSRASIVPNAPHLRFVPRMPRRISPFQPRPLLAPARPSRSMPDVNASQLQVILVKPGDSFWKISREYLGRGARWQELLAVNPGFTSPNYLTAGSEILVPRSAPVASSSRINSSGRITVHKGDTLWSLARAHFGHGSDWTCLAHSNPNLRDPNFILPGEQIFIPAACSSAP
jgi:nucleoid-associated protein YgaU